MPCSSTLSYGKLELESKADDETILSGLQACYYLSSHPISPQELTPELLRWLRGQESSPKTQAQSHMVEGTDPPACPFQILLWHAHTHTRAQTYTMKLLSEIKKELRH